MVWLGILGIRIFELIILSTWVIQFSCQLIWYDHVAKLIELLLLLFYVISRANVSYQNISRVYCNNYKSDNHPSYPSIFFFTEKISLEIYIINFISQ